MMSPSPTQPTNPPSVRPKSETGSSSDQFRTDSEIPIGWIGRTTDGLGQQTDKKWRPIDRREDYERLFALNLQGPGTNLLAVHAMCSPLES